MLDLRRCAVHQETTQDNQLRSFYEGNYTNSNFVAKLFSMLIADTLKLENPAVHEAADRETGQRYWRLTFDVRFLDPDGHCWLSVHGMSITRGQLYAPCRRYGSKWVRLCHLNEELVTAIVAAARAAGWDERFVTVTWP